MRKKKKRALTKALEAAFWAWGETITEMVMEENPPIEIWYRTFIAGVSAEKERAESCAKRKKP